MVNKGYWVFPDGSYKELEHWHIDEILKRKEEFDLVELGVDLSNDTELFEVAFRRGWVRVRQNRNFWVVECGGGLELGGVKRLLVKLCEEVWVKIDKWAKVVIVCDREVWTVAVSDILIEEEGLCGL